MTDFTRRDLLKGVSLGAGALLLSPILDKIHADAAGSAVKPKRFVFVLEGNGVHWRHIQPKGIGDNYQRNPSGTPIPPGGLDEQSLAKLDLPKCLEPLESFKDRLTIVQGLSGKVCGGGHSNNFGALGVYPSKAGVLAETIDVALAKALPGIFPHVGLGIVGKGDESIVYNVSASGPGKPVPMQTRPDLAYKTLFGSVAKDAGKAAFTADGNVIDFMADDVRRVESRLVGAEREKFQQHVAAYEAMKQRQSRLNDIESSLRAAAPVVSNKYTSEVETDRLDAQFDLTAAALIGGLTNVALIGSGCGDQFFGITFTGLGINLGKHGIGHGGGFDGKTADELSQIIRRFHVEQIARLAKKLDSVKEGDGTMLDNTLIIYLSDSAEQHHSRCDHWPLFLVGNLGGTLKTNGRYLCYPKYGTKGHRTIANFYTTLLHAAGTPRDHFGTMDPMLKDLDQKGPLAELMA
jgi:hypothetical protein